MRQTPVLSFSTAQGRRRRRHFTRVNLTFPSLFFFLPSVSVGNAEAVHTRR